MTSTVIFIILHILMMLSPLSPSKMSPYGPDSYFSNPSSRSRSLSESNSSSSKSKYMFDISISDWNILAPSKGIAYTIMVFADNLSYIVQRTEADFIALDQKLLKYFPTLTPFLSNTMRDDNKSSKGSPQKKENFIDEGIVSTELFLPRKSMSTIPSVHDILLSKEDTECTVLRTKDVTFEIHVPSIVLWRFSTQDFDIGFSVEFNGVQKIEFSRVPSHQKVICGSLEVIEPGICHLKWDNTYSKFHLKTLRLSTATVSPEQYDVACETVNELYKTLKVYDKQRLIVKRCVLKKVAKTGLLHKLSPEEEQEDSKLEAADSLQNDLLTVRAQLACAQDQLMEAHSYIEELEEGKRIVEAARDQILDSWRFSLTQLNTAKEEIRRLKALDNKEMTVKVEAIDIHRKEELSLSNLPSTSAHNSADDDEVVL